MVVDQVAGIPSIDVRMPGADLVLKTYLQLHHLTSKPHPIKTIDYSKIHMSYFFLTLSTCLFNFSFLINSLYLFLIVTSVTPATSATSLWVLFSP